MLESTVLRILADEMLICFVRNSDINALCCHGLRVFRRLPRADIITVLDPVLFSFPSVLLSDSRLQRHLVVYSQVFICLKRQIFASFCGLLLFYVLFFILKLRLRMG